MVSCRSSRTGSSVTIGVAVAEDLFAGIIGLGCGIGIRKMARISRQIHEAELEYTVNWFSRLRAARRQ